MQRIPTYILAAMLTSACATRAAPPHAPQPAKPKTTHTELARLSRSTVTLMVLSEGFWGTQRSTREGTGSGFVIAHQGARAVVTAAHVVRAATQVVVVDAEGRSADATELLAYDPRADIAVLEVPELSPTIPAIPVGEAPEVGEEVMVVSSPLGLSTTVAFGTVAALRPEARALQLAAGVSPGSSGGLVADGRGRAIGVIRSKAPTQLGGENIALATPISFVSDSLRGKPTPLSARPNRRSMQRIARHQLTSTKTPPPADGSPPLYAGEANLVMPVGERQLEHVCARSSDKEAVLSIREVGNSDPKAWREGVGRSCASLWGGQRIEVWVSTKEPGRRVELTISRQK